jgi:hypothetical protein
VAVAHPKLADSLDLSTYRSTLYETVSMQTCDPKTDTPSRLGMPHILLTHLMCDRAVTSSPQVRQGQSVLGCNFTG